MTDAERLANIQNILDRGIRRATTGDKTVEYDLDALRKEREDLLRKIAASSGVSAYKRVVMNRG